jgi:hypothetical protein
MNSEIFAEWLRRQKHNVYKTQSSYWYDAGPHVLQAFPYNRIITPDDWEIKNLMLKHRIIALRYSAPADFHEGKISYHIVLDRSYELSLLNQKTRNGVKRGLERFKVEEISFDRLANEGWILQEDTLARQRRKGSMSRKQWELLCKSAKGLPGFHAFGAVSGGELAGAVIVSRIDDVYTVPYAMSHCRFLQDHVNNALFYSVSCELLRRENVKGIFYTVQSLDAPPKVDEFKLRMGFELKMVRQVVVMHPLLKPIITPSVYSLNRNLLNLFPSSSLLAKSEGMIRFHLEGRRPLKEQIWPECLNEKMILSDTKNIKAG